MQVTELSKILGGIFQFYILFFFLWIGCSLFAGPQKAPFWFALIGLGLLALIVVGAITQRRR